MMKENHTTSTGLIVKSFPSADVTSLASSIVTDNQQATTAMGQQEPTPPDLVEPQGTNAGAGQSLAVPGQEMAVVSSTSDSKAAATPEDLIKPKVDFLPCLFKAGVLHFHDCSEDLASFRQTMAQELKDQADMVTSGQISLDSLIPSNKESKKPFVRY